MALSFYQGVRELFPESRIVCFRPYSLRGVLPSGLIDEEWEFKKEEIQKGSSRKEWIRFSPRGVTLKIWNLVSLKKYQKSLK